MGDLGLELPLNNNKNLIKSKFLVFYSYFKMFGSVPQKFKEEKPDQDEKKEEVKSDKPAAMKTDSIREDEFTKRRKEKIHGYLPAIHEWRNDLCHHYEAMSVKMGPITLEHLSNEKIFESLQNSQHFQIRLKRISREDDFTGHITVSFEDDEFAAETASDLTKACPDVIVKHTKPVDDKPVDVTDIIKSERDLHNKVTPPIQNIIVLSRLFPETTENEIQEKFPTAKSILIPKDSRTNEPRLYAYVEMPTKQEVDKLDGTHITLGEDENARKIQLYKLKRYPPVGTVIKKLESEKELFSSKRPVSQIPIEQREALIELYRLGCHYERSMYINEKKREIVVEGMKKFRAKFPKINVLKSKQAYGRGNARGNFRGGNNFQPKNRSFGAGGGRQRNRGSARRGHVATF